MCHVPAEDHVRRNPLVNLAEKEKTNTKKNAKIESFLLKNDEDLSFFDKIFVTLLGDIQIE